MNVGKFQAGFVIWPWIFILPIVAVGLWIIPLPSVTVHNPADGKVEFNYVWNVHDRTYRGQMPPGGRTLDHGFLFPEEDFFMWFYWWDKNNGRRRCVSITPKWRNTHIYLDADGNIDRSKDSGTHVDRLSPCPHE